LYVRTPHTKAEELLNNYFICSKLANHLVPQSETKRFDWKERELHLNICGDSSCITYLIFVIFSPQALFLAKIFSTQKRVNRNKPILRQNSVNRQKKTQIWQQNSVNATKYHKLYTY
jgi:hypothetical protein